MQNKLYLNTYYFIVLILLKKKNKQENAFKHPKKGLSIEIKNYPKEWSTK